MATGVDDEDMESFACGVRRIVFSVVAVKVSGDVDGCCSMGGGGGL
jgi:hypothetical protein